ncbi:MAG: menaquinone biosynthesis protein [Desulfuromonadaceae bacterium]|nr:menaquinone biosynthesis protein [Desulfuromonadaceae bacterium]
MELTLGHIDYLNCVPFFHYLRTCGFRGEILKGVPAQLNEMLAEGLVDASPSSSFEYGRNFTNYLLLPGHSISAFNQVQSVMLFSREPIADIKDSPIYLTGESATSVHLLKVLLREFYAWGDVEGIVPQQPAEDLIDEGKPVLLIGDKALKQRIKLLDTGWHCYDLAQLWALHTGLPFVFALWIVRADLADEKKPTMQALPEQLRCARIRAEQNILELAQNQPQCSWITPEQLVDYWHAMSYDLEEIHIEGLKLFFYYCHKFKFLPHIPEICFVSAPEQSTI